MILLFKFSSLHECVYSLCLAFAPITLYYAYYSFLYSSSFLLFFVFNETSAGERRPNRYFYEYIDESVLFALPLSYYVYCSFVLTCIFPSLCVQRDGAAGKRVAEPLRDSRGGELRDASL